MTVAFWCVLIAIFLPYLCNSIAKFSGGNFGLRQNHDPRAYLETLEGFPGGRKRHSSTVLK